MNSCSSGLAAHLPNLTSKTTRSRKNGARTGVFRSIAGTECAPTILCGGASGCALCGIAACKIPQWEVYEGQIMPGEKYERRSVATYTTHDHKPIRALWEEAFERPTATSDQSRFDLAKIAVFAGLDPNLNKIDFEKDFYPAIMEALFKSNAWIAVVMITDLLARKYRFNIPGTPANLNWTRRMQRSIRQLSSSRKERSRVRLIHQLLVKTSRI